MCRICEKYTPKHNSTGFTEYYPQDLRELLLCEYTELSTTGLGVMKGRFTPQILSRDYSPNKSSITFLMEGSTTTVTLYFENPEKIRVYNDGKVWYKENGVDWRYFGAIDTTKPVNT